MTVAPTLTLEEAHRRHWEIIVVGAGPAGSLAAYELARRGARVLLVDKARFPRWKVCGGCLNRTALSILRESGLADLPARHGAVPLRCFRFYVNNNFADVSLPDGAALSRLSFDNALVQAAIDAGAEFLAETTATSTIVSPSARTMFLRQRYAVTEASASILIAADGLAGTLFANQPGRRASVHQKSWIGAGAMASEGPPAYCPGTIFMGWTKRGYVGVARVEGGQLTIGAALRPDALTLKQGLAQAALDIAKESGLPPFPDLSRLNWRGTPALTRKASCVAGHRLFILGDAAGYAEPLTGEGMAWALAAGKAVAPLAARAATRWHPGLIAEWRSTFEKIVHRRQRVCRLLTGALRRPAAARTLVLGLARLPALARPFVRYMN